MQCSNCADEAMYIYDPRGAVATYFCGAHLPSFLQKSAKSGLLKTTEHFSDVRASALAELRPAPVEEATAEVVEEEEAPAPKRRRSRKKAIVESEVPAEENLIEEPPADEADSES